MAGPADAGAVVSPDAVEAIGKHGAGERKTGKRSGEEGTTGDGGGEGACGSGVREGIGGRAGGLRRMLRRREPREC